MKYIANPVQVEAHRIIEVGEYGTLGKFHDCIVSTCQPITYAGRILKLDNGQDFEATDGMLARMTPAVGDYVVIQEDGYTYLNPRDVFEKKYSPLFGSGARLYVILAHHGVGTMHTTADLDRDEILNLSPQQITQRYMEPAAAALQNSYRAFDGPALPLPPAKQEEPK